MYNVRLSIIKAALHRSARSITRPAPNPYVPGVFTLLVANGVLFMLVILRILETRGGG